MRIGRVSLRLASDGVYWEDGGGLFGLVPKMLWQEVWAPDERNRLPKELRSLLIETPTQLILVDTGYGDKLPAKQRGFISLAGERRLFSSLASLGVEPRQVDLVINTHLHYDHCGGNTGVGADGKVQPVFHKATYCVQRLELADASFPNERTKATYMEENWAPIDQAGQLRVLSGDARLTDEVRVIVTPGHTRSHQCVLIESGGETAVFLGDVASWPIHMERPSWVPAYDAEPMISIETKRNLALWAIERHALLIFEHHVNTAAGYLLPTERPDRFRLDPVAFD